MCLTRVDKVETHLCNFYCQHKQKRLFENITLICLLLISKYYEIGFQFVLLVREYLRIYYVFRGYNFPVTRRLVFDTFLEVETVLNYFNNFKRNNKLLDL